MINITLKPALQCAEVENLLADFINGDLDVELDGRIEAHIEMCESCGRLFSLKLGEIVSDHGLLLEVESWALAAATPKSEFDGEGPYEQEEVKEFSYEQIVLRLQKDLENEEELLVTLEVRDEHRDAWEGTTANVLTHRGKHLLNGVIRWGKVEGIAKCYLEDITEPPKVYLLRS